MGPAYDGNAQCVCIPERVFAESSRYQHADCNAPWMSRGLRRRSGGNFNPAAVADASVAASTARQLRMSADAAASRLGSYRWFQQRHACGVTCGGDLSCYIHMKHQLAHGNTIFRYHLHRITTHLQRDSRRRAVRRKRVTHGDIPVQRI